MAPDETEEAVALNLVNRYILRAFCRVFSLSLGAFVGVYLLVEFFEKIDDFIEHEATAVHYAVFFGSKIPLIVTQVAPLAVLLAVFMTLGGFSRTNELTAMRAGGISLWRISTPLLGVGLLTAVSVLTLTEFVVPIAARKMNYTLDVAVKGRAENLLKRENIWFREEGSIFHIDLAVPENALLRGIHVFTLDEQFHIATRLDAPKAEFRDGRWIADHAVIRHFSPESGDLIFQERREDEILPLTKSPQEFEATQAKNDELTFSDLRRLAQRLQQEGYNPVRYRVDLHARLSTPFSSLIMAFIGIPFALKKGRGSNLAIGISVALAIGLAYYLFQSLILAFGYAAALPPFVAAWAPNLLFFLIGIWMLLTVRE